MLRSASTAAVDSKLAPDAALKARHAVFAQIERESLDKTGYQSNVVTLYGGAIYQLYRYKRYSDIRVVFAPEFQAAFFGGDPDNFEYPRFDFDITLLRAYEDGKPAHVDNFLRISPKGVGNGDLVFVSGHPGHTDRLLPISMLRRMRDRVLPLRLDYQQREAAALLDYSAKNDETHRRANEDLFYTQNSIKSAAPQLAVLKGNLIEQKQEQEDVLRAHLRSRMDLKHYDSAWDRIAIAEKAREQLQARYFFLENGRAFATWLFHDARELVRLAAEDAKPDAQRLPEYTESKRKPLEHDLFSDYPFYEDLETVELTTSLQFFRDTLGSDDPLVQKVLQGKEPAARATELVHGTRVAAADERKRIYKGRAAAIASSDDPMIVLAREIDSDARAIRTAYESQVQEPETQALTEINQARFALLGASDYPDATGTLRLAFGIVKGYEQDGAAIAPWTTFAGAFQHEQEHGAKDPFMLPPSWGRAKEKLDLDAPLNFVCTADIIGGNSGSPVVNRDGELVGVIFDSNRQGVASGLGYSADPARAVAVDSRGILEALRKIYGAEALLAELTGAKQ